MAEESPDPSTPNEANDFVRDRRLSPKGPRSASSRLLDVILLVAIGLLGLSAIRWGLTHKPKSSPNKIGPAHPASLVKPGDSIINRTRTSVAGSRSPFQISRYRSTADVARQSQDCVLIKSASSQQDVHTQSFIVAPGKTCILNAGQLRFSVSQVWFDPAGLRSAQLVSQGNESLDVFWSSIEKSAQPTDGVGEVYCWSDVCVRRSQNVLGIWRRSPHPKAVSSSQQMRPLP